MIGDKYIVKENCFDGVHQLVKGEILTEGERNEIIHDVYGYVCEVGSRFAKKYLEICS